MTEDTQLLRQINPAWNQSGRVTSQAFRPTPKDEFLLSVYDGDQISPEGSWRHFVGRGLKSDGVLAVTVRECSTEALTALSSPEVFQEHAHIDFSGLTEGQMKGKGKRLLASAMARGWLHKA